MARIRGRRWIAANWISMCLTALVGSQTLIRAQSAHPASAGSPRMDSAAQRPLAFEENRGHMDSRVKIFARAKAYTLFLTNREAAFRLRGRSPATAGGDRVLRLQFVGAAPDAAIRGEEPQTAKTYYTQSGSSSL